MHALAYDIIGIVEGAKPALADHATDDMAFTNLIKQILKDLVHRLSEVSKAIIQFFAHFLVEPKTDWDFKTKHDFDTHMEAQDLRTLQGENVNSYEELQIANWLYENGVEYEYEPVYEHKIPETGRRDYRCEHVQHCGNLLPACPSCGTALPRRRTDGTLEVLCGCGAAYPICPQCEDGWLVKRSGGYGKFLGCVRYPTCVGKAKISSGEKPVGTKARRQSVS